MITVGTTSKLGGMALAFWTKLEGEANLWKERAVSVLIVGTSLVSIALLVFKGITMTGFSSWWEHSQCLGVIMSTAPWTQNIVLYMWKVLASGALRTEPDSIIELAKSQSKKDAAKEKGYVFAILVACTGLAFLMFNGFFTITNLLPAFFAFLWAPIPVLVLGFGLMCVFERVIETRLTNKEFILNFAIFMAFPIAIGADLVVQWLAAASVYLYAGIGYMQAAWMATSERQTGLYFANLVHQVLGHASWLAELLNQVLP